MGWMPQPKDKDWLNGYKSKTPIYAVYKRPISKQGTHTDWKWRAGKKIFHLSNRTFLLETQVFPDGSDGKESACNAGDGVQSLDREEPLEKGMATHSTVLAWEFHGQRSLVPYSPWGCQESDMTEQLTHIRNTFFSLDFSFQPLSPFLDPFPHLQFMPHPSALSATKSFA